MRGVVTLAAAFVIPEDAPHREVLLLVAFTVVAGTLFLQGLTLPLADPAASTCPPPTRPRTPWPAPRLLQRPRTPGFARLDELEYDDHHGVADQIRARARPAHLRGVGAAGHHRRRGDARRSSTPGSGGEMIEAERAKVLLVRSKGKVPSEVVSQVLGMLDIEESMLDAGSAARDGVRSGSRSTFAGGRTCDDLDAHPAVETVGEPACADLPGRRHPLGVAAPVPRRAATSAAATPPSASTPPPTSTTACTR